LANELASRLKISLDELRMQVLGAQVLLGFQFQSLFQPGFQRAGTVTRVVAAIGLVAICLSLAGLIAPAAQHRLVERGDASSRILNITRRCAEVSLGLLALALASDVYVAVSLQRGSHPLEFACAALLVALGMWFGVGLGLREINTQQDENMVEKVPIHTMIEQMLTEARVILPGAQAMLGFQLIVTMTQPFNDMAAGIKLIHFIALGAVILTVILLITPAAVHRLSFAGRDDAGFYRIGSQVITIALVPLAIGIVSDFAVAAWRLSTSGTIAAAAGAALLCILIGFWYAWPLAVRKRTRASGFKR
jgi:Family of unknown function (DUF6328)